MVLGDVFRRRHTPTVSKTPKQDVPRKVEDEGVWEESGELDVLLEEHTEARAKAFGHIPLD
eukprot:6704248-Lingulodinium_polyedra.AAC.1